MFFFTTRDEKRRVSFKTAGQQGWDVFQYGSPTRVMSFNTAPKKYFFGVLVLFIYCTTRDGANFEF